jgi:hypothetical protein
LSDWVRTIRSLVQGPSFTANRIFVRWIDNSFVEQVDDPAMYLSLYGVLWSLGIQYKWGKSSDSLPEGMFKEVIEGQQKYCETVYSRSGINHMWILKNSRSFG